MNIPQVAHLVACKVSGLSGHHNWSRYAPDMLQLPQSNLSANGCIATAVNVVL